MGAAAPLMNLSREQLLAAARLAENENGRLGWSDKLDLRKQPAKRRTVAHNPAERECGVRLFTQVRVLVLQLFL
jgi:hypothetical protein